MELLLEFFCQVGAAVAYMGGHVAHGDGLGAVLLDIADGFHQHIVGPVNQLQPGHMGGKIRDSMGQQHADGFRRPHADDFLHVGLFHTEREAAGEPAPDGGTADKGQHYDGGILQVLQIICRQVPQIIRNLDAGKVREGLYIAVLHYV